MQEWKGVMTMNKGLASMATLFLATGTCSAFTAAPIRWRGPLQSEVEHIPPSGSVCLQRATPTDVIDAMPSDVTPEFDSMSEGGANTAEPDLALAMAMDLLKVISSSVGDDYLPYSEADKRAIEEMVEELESSGEGNQGTDVKFPRDLSKLDGRWRLMFTNTLVGVAKVSPLTLKDVYQVVDASSGILTNVAYGTISPPLFAETWGRLGQRLESLAKNVEDVVSFPVDFNIEHAFQVSSQSKPAQIEIVQKELKLLNVEDPAKRSIALPILQPLAKAAAGRFDTTFLYKDVRISRGRFGEIRVFQRVA